MGTTNDVEIRTEGSIGHLTLNRPKALNALTLDMIDQMTAALLRWEQDDQIATVLIDGAGERAFCAGGDIVAVYNALSAEPPALHEPELLWRHQHELDVLIADYRKPVVTVMNGITLGGGVGLACHAQFRVVTENARLGMPETSIGLPPDVAALHLLGRSPGYLGHHIALTGQMFGPRTAILAGLADVALPADAIGALADGLTAGEDPAGLLARLAVEPDTLPAGKGIEPAEAELESIARCYASEDLATVVQRLEQADADWSHAALERIGAAAPLAVAVTHHVLHSETAKDRWATFAQDLRRNVNFSRHPDMAEGIRVTMVDKGTRPTWSHAGLADVGAQEIAACLAPFGGAELDVAGVLSRP